MRLIDWLPPSGLAGDRPGIGTSSDVEDPRWRIKHSDVDNHEQWNGKVDVDDELDPVVGGSVVTVRPNVGDPDVGVA